jgi:propionate CoA-transferase
VGVSRRIDQLLCSADDAAAVIGDGVTIVCGAFVGAAHPEALRSAIERRFVGTT